MEKVIIISDNGKNRSYYNYTCPICNKNKLVRGDKIKTIKSCHSCHHTVRNPPQPSKNTDWCNKCKSWLPYDKFNYRKDGKKRNCKPCETKYRKENQVEITKKQIIWKHKNPNKSLLFAAKSRARQYGLLFNIDLNDVIVPEFCPVLGIKLSCDENKNTSPSLDRIIPELGYTKGNVQVISWRANWLKNNATLEEIRSLYLYLKDKM
jgi:hypothetical protein